MLSSFQCNTPFASGAVTAPSRKRTEVPNKKTLNIVGRLCVLGAASETTAGITSPMANPIFQDKPVPVDRSTVGKRSLRKIRSGDGAYDQDGLIHGVIGHDPEAAVIVSPCHDGAERDGKIEPTQCDRHLQCIAGRQALCSQLATTSGDEHRMDAGSGESRRWVYDPS